MKAESQQQHIHIIPSRGSRFASHSVIGEVLVTGHAGRVALGEAQMATHSAEKATASNVAIARAIRDALSRGNAF